MTEWEKAVSGALYDASDEALCRARLRCKDLCFQYNQCLPSDRARQQELLGQLIGRLHGEVEVTAPFFCDYGCNIELGEGFYCNHNCVILDGAQVTIGAHVLLGPNCCITTAGHPLDLRQRGAGLEFARPVTIEDHVWLGANVTVLPGVRIGRGSVIGAGSVVSRDIPAGVLALGSPCRPLRRLAPEECP